MLASHPPKEGKMLNVVGPVYKTEPLFQEFLSSVQSEFINISSINNNKLIVLSGKADLIDEAKEFYRCNKVATRPLNVSSAFHSKLMEKAQIDFKDLVSKIKLDKPKYKIISTLTAQEVSFSNFESEMKELLVEQLTSKVDLLSAVRKVNHTVLFDLVKRKEIDKSLFI